MRVPSRTSLFMIAVFVLFVHRLALADPEFTWVNPIGGTDDDSAARVATDRNDDVIVTGSFSGTISFDATTSLTADDGNDLYVAKYSPGGSLLWARKYGGTGGQIANALTVDGYGNILIAGTFGGEITVGRTMLTEVGGVAFYTKLAEDGEPIWLRQTGGQQTRASAIELDGLGNIVLAGTIFGRDPAVFGTVSITPTTGGATDGFVAKFSPDGRGFRWVQHLESDLNVFGLDLAVGSNVYVTGSMNASMHVDGVLLASLPTVALGYGFDGFVVTLDGATGARVEGQLAGGRGIDSERGFSITTDASGNALATGQFSGTVPEDDLWSTIPWAGGSDLYIVAHGPRGMPTWSEFAGGPLSDAGTALTVDDSGAVVAGTFQGDWTLAGTPISAPPGSGTINADMLVAHYTRNPAASRGWDWVVTAGSAEQDTPMAVAVDGANDVVVSGAVGASPAQFGSLRLVGAGGTEAFVAKLAEPSDLLPEDPYEVDPVIDNEWELVPWRCINLRTPRDCPDVFKTNFIDYPSETIWTMRIDDLVWVSQDDIDRFVLTLPEPAAEVWGDRYHNISAEPFVDGDDDELDDASGRPREPLLECHSVEREVYGPNPRGVRTIRVSTGGRLTVEVIPSGADPISLRGERVVVSDAGSVLARAAAAGDVAVSCPHTPAYDPRVEPRPPNRTQLNLAVGERDGLRARSALGSYSLQLTYRIEAHRVGPPWVLDQMFAKGIRELGGIFCLGGRGSGFPRCPAGPDGFSVVEFLHPGFSDFFDCIADGPGCWDIRSFYWPQTEEPFDLRLSSDRDISFTLYDEQQTMIGAAAPMNLEHGINTASRFTKQISQTQMASGRYFLVMEGRPAAVSARFMPPHEMQPPASRGIGRLWWLTAVLIILALAIVLLRRRGST